MPLVTPKPVVAEALRPVWTLKNSLDSPKLWETEKEYCH